MKMMNDSKHIIIWTINLWTLYEDSGEKLKIKTVEKGRTQNAPGLDMKSEHEGSLHL